MLDTSYAEDTSRNIRFQLIHVLPEFVHLMFTSEMSLIQLTQFYDSEVNNYYTDSMQTVYRLYKECKRVVYRLWTCCNLIAHMVFESKVCLIQLVHVFISQMKLLYRLHANCIQAMDPSQHRCLRDGNYNIHEFIDHIGHMLR